MADWSSGYVSEIAYTYGYYAELNPIRTRLAFLNSGLVCPTFVTACELGFGQGLSANLHAAGSTTTWFGTDFNPAQASFAQQLAAVSGAHAKLFDESFADFCARSDLPDFDVISLHGIWSWISDANRAIIVDFVRRKLKVGGVLYVSYNTLPGWAAFAPMRHLITEHAEILGSEGRGIVNRIDGAIDFAEKLLATNPAFLRANPPVSERLKNIKGQNRHYLAHEYLNQDWHPMHFATMAQWLEPAKVQYACSANYLDHIDLVNLTAEQQTFLADIPDPMFRQTVRDFMVNQQFRKDYWVKGSRKLSALEQAEALRALSVMLVTPRQNIALKVTGGLGEISLKEEIYNPFLDLMADYRTRSLAEIENSLKPKGLNLAQILQMVLVLSGIGHIVPVQSEQNTSSALKPSKAVNAYLMNKARGDGDIQYLASPVTGGGVSIDRFQQLFLSALKQGKKQPQDWAIYVWHILKSQGQTLMKEGKKIESEEENLALLSEQAHKFAEQLPIMRALQIV